jgi:hypothetical protein
VGVGVGVGVADLAVPTGDCLWTPPGNEAEVVGQCLMEVQKQFVAGGYLVMNPRISS